MAIFSIPHKDPSSSEPDLRVVHIADKNRSRDGCIRNHLNDSHIRLCRYSVMSHINLWATCNIFTSNSTDLAQVGERQRQFISGHHITHRYYWECFNCIESSVHFLFHLSKVSTIKSDPNHYHSYTDSCSLKSVWQMVALWIQLLTYMIIMKKASRDSCFHV